MNNIDHQSHDPQVAQESADTRRMLGDAVAAFVARKTTLNRVRALRDAEPGFDRALWGEMARLGWLGILVPQAYGGHGMGFAEMRVVAEGLAAVVMPEPLNACAVLASRTLLGGDNETLKCRLAPQIVTGDLMLGLAWQESGGSTDPLNICTRAILAGGRWRLNGTKRFVVPTCGADGFIVSARHADALNLFYLPANAPGIGRNLERCSDGSFAGILQFSDTPVAVESRVAGSETASGAIVRAIEEATVIACAELYGVMSRALAITLAYMKIRIQFGKPIGSFQALQHRAVDLFIQKELAIGALDDAIRALDAGSGNVECALAASRCKSRCADAALTITRESIKLHGAIGFSDECDVGLYLQRALVLSAWLGNGAEHRARYTAMDPQQENKSAVPSFTAAPAGGEPAAADEHGAGTDWNALSDETFRHQVRGYFERHYPEHLRYLLRRARWQEMHEWVLRMARKGWMAPAWPTEYGGMGLSPSKQVIFLEERERWGVARWPDQGITLLGPALLKYGTAKQKAVWLPKILSGEHMWCQGYSEPNAGSDLASLQTDAVPDGSDYVVNGQKIWTSLAHDATHMFLLVRTDKQAKKRQEGISFFLLDLTTPGITIRPIRNIEGREEFCQVFFDNVRIPKGNMVGEVNKGWTVAKALLGFERLNDGSPRRVQYPLNMLRIVAHDRNLWHHPEFRCKYTQLQLDVMDLASAYARFADIVKRGEHPGPDISMLKIWAGETLQHLAALLIESAGSSGCFTGKIKFGADMVDVLGPLGMVFPATIAAGTSDIQRNVLAKRVLGLPS